MVKPPWTRSESATKRTSSGIPSLARKRKYKEASAIPAAEFASDMTRSAARSMKAPDGVRSQARPLLYIVKYFASSFCRSARLPPGPPSTGHREHVFVTHFLEVVRGERGPEATAAVQDDLGVLVRN